jgi:hypothetical protein
MWYELWDGETGNRVGTYPTEDAALQALTEDIARYGRESEAILTLGLLRRDPDSSREALIAEGTALAERAVLGQKGNPRSNYGQTLPGWPMLTLATR